MIKTNENGKFTVKTAAYTAVVSEESIDFVIAGEVLAGLRPVSAVHTCGEGDDTNFDAECDGVSLSICEDGGVPTCIWTSKSNLWEKKEYILRFHEDHFAYSIRLTGKGAVDRVCYFSGNMDKQMKGSMYEFDTGFTPIVTVQGTKQCYFSAMEDQEVFSFLMVPPMFVYSFTTPGVEPKMAFALAADKGEHNFTQFNYKTAAENFRRRFWFETDQSGHVTVDGTWETPRVLCYTASSDMNALKFYSDYYFKNGIARPKAKDEFKPRWWYGPMVCGWIEQAAYGMKYGGGYSSIDACEPIYRNFIDEVHKKNLNPQIMIIDDKWQTAYGSAKPNPDKWPDLRAFIDENLEKNNIHTMLWYKLWDAEGLDEDEIIPGCGWEGCDTCDPSNPKYRARLKEIIHHLLSADEGCCNAYGFKLDYAFIQPVGRKVKTYSGKYGVELLLDLISYIYKCAKEVKPEAIINCSPCHPLFAEYCDQARLHDYYPDLRRCFEEFKFRKEVYEIAMPGVVFDTDGAAFSSYRDTMRYMRLAPTIGVPDIYCITEMPSLALSDDDWAEVSAIWKEYARRIDAQYE